MNSILISFNSEYSNESTYNVFVSECDPTSWQSVATNITYDDFPVSVGLDTYGITGSCYQYYVVGSSGCSSIGSGETGNPCPTPSPTPTPSVTTTVTPSVTPSITPSITPTTTPTVTPTPSVSVAGALYDLFCPSTVPGGCPFTFITPEGNSCSGTVISDSTFTFCVQVGTTPTCVNGLVIDLNEGCADNGCSGL